MEETAVNTTRAPNETNSSATRPPNPLWILFSVTIGFLLPVCSCMMFFLVSVASLSFADIGGPSPTMRSGGDAVAIVRVEGPIISDDSSDISSATSAISGVVMADLRRADEDPAVKAIVLRVDSPGGSVTGSAQIYESVRAIDKPVVVSMAGTAASGGYYVSAPADHIMARPDTVTGSIGVIVTLFNAEDLIDDIGVEVNTITTGPNKAMGSAWEDLTPEQRDIIEEWIDESYREFVQVIVDGRNLNREAVLALADGRIYSGRQALPLGLVDELGNLQDAIDKAAELGGISGEPRIIEYQRLPDFTQLFGNFNQLMTQSEADRVWAAIEEFTVPTVEYRYVGPQSK